MKRDTFDFQTEYDEYIESTPLEARFDPMTLQVLVMEAIPKHAAYGMLIDEYIKQRGRFSEYDESEKKRLSFYLPRFPAMVSCDYADDYKTSHHRFITMMIELGLITFQFDYNEQYSEIKNGRRRLFESMTTTERKARYLQVDKQTISIGSCDQARRGKSKHFTPNVQEWLYNAISDVSNYINMSMSDFCYLCWCIGIDRSIPEFKSNKFVKEENVVVFAEFNSELRMYYERITDTISRNEVVE